MRIYAISTEPTEDEKGLQEELGDAVTLLSDPGGEVVSAFGMMDAKHTTPREGLARAGTMFIDRDGKLRAHWIAERYDERPDPEELLAEVR